MRNVQENRSQMRVRRHILDPDGVSFPVIAGGAGDDEPDNDTDPNQPQVDVPEGYRLISDDAYTNLKGAADRKVSAERINRENRLLKAVPGLKFTEDGEIASEEIRDLLDSNASIETVIRVAKATTRPAEGEGSEKQEADDVPSDPEQPEDADAELEAGEEKLAEYRKKLRGQGTDTPPGEDAEDPYQRAEKRHDRARENRAKREVARREYIDEIFQAANNGDERVLVKDAPEPFKTR